VVAGCSSVPWIVVSIVTVHFDMILDSRIGALGPHASAFLVWAGARPS